MFRIPTKFPQRRLLPRDCQGPEAEAALASGWHRGSTVRTVTGRGGSGREAFTVAPGQKNQLVGARRLWLREAARAYRGTRRE